MTVQLAPPPVPPVARPTLPVWAVGEGPDTPGNLALRAGAVLLGLDPLIRTREAGVPLALLANRLALAAAAATARIEGRGAVEREIRDAWHLTPPGSDPGPDGAQLVFWRNAVRQGGAGRRGTISSDTILSGTGFGLDAKRWVEMALERAGSHGPLAGSVAVMQAVLDADARQERLACLLSDVVIAQWAGWSRVLPVSARCLTKAFLRDIGTSGGTSEGRLQVQGRLLEALTQTLHLAWDLAGRAAALQAVAPKLRAKGSAAAVALFLREDAVAPSTMLSPLIQGSGVPMTSRAARRFCDRLVALGVARELTGRSSFRLYGIAP